MTVLPTFQPQNPAKNGYSLGWLSCTAYSGAMAAAYHRQAKQIMTGEQLRRRTGDTTGGLNLAQIDSALNSGWNIDLTVHYRLSWASFVKLINGGCGAVLQGWYAPIADSRFDAGRGFRGNHAVAVFPGFVTMDPLADGRPGAYRYHGEPYPQQMLRSFAGKLNIASTGYRALGDGLVYAAVTADREHTYRLHFDAGAFWVYELDSSGRIRGRHAERFSKPTSAACTPPRRHDWPGVGTRTLSQVTNPRSSLHGEYIQVPQGNVHLELVP